MMTRRLILMRHAESASAAPGGSDHARILTARGRQDAERVARRIVAMGWAPEFVLSSDAQRTQETWASMAPALEDPVPAHFVSALYHAGLESLWTESHALSAQTETALALGHNPGWSYALDALCGAPHPLTPASAALLEGQGEDWPQALRGPWRLMELIRPEELRGG